MLRSCIDGCLRQYREDLGTKTVTIIVGCALTAVFFGDFTGLVFLKCLAVGGVAEVTVGLPACIVKCLRSGGT